jgi:hypothetical protein
MALLLKIKAYLATLDLAHGFGAALGRAWRWIAGLPRRVWNAIKAFLATPQVWLAAPAFLFAGYLVGFALLEPKLINVRDQARALTKTVDVLKSSNAALTTETAVLRDEIKKLKEAQKPVEAAAPAPAVKSPPEAPKTASVKRKAAPKPTGSTGFWW